MLLMKRSQPLHRREPIDAQLGTCGDQIVGERRRAPQDHCARQREQTNDGYSPATVGQAPEGGGGVDQVGLFTSPWQSRPPARKTHSQAKAACTAGSARPVEQRLARHPHLLRGLRHRQPVADHRHHGLIPLLSHAQLPHQGSVKDQPKQLSSISP
jgi:hypothetical protein